MSKPAPDAMDELVVDLNKRLDILGKIIDGADTQGGQPWVKDTLLKQWLTGTRAAVNTANLKHIEVASNPALRREPPGYGLPPKAPTWDAYDIARLRDLGSRRS